MRSTFTDINHRVSYLKKERNEEESERRKTHLNHLDQVRLLEPVPVRPYRPRTERSFAIVNGAEQFRPFSGTDFGESGGDSWAADCVGEGGDE